MKKTLLYVLAVAILAGVAVLAGSVSAKNVDSEIRLGFNASTTASTTLKRVVKLDKATVTLQARADKEIDRRIVALNKLLNKIQGMKKVSVADKADFATTVQGQINLLNNLKIKINADTDITTLEADVQFITKAYRIYALIMPQIEIMAAADRLSSTTDLLSAYATKLQARITMAQTGGKNVTSLQTLLTDMKAKIADAKVQSVAAIAGVRVLVPDNGDKTVMTTNTVALKAARTAINKGVKDLKDANKDGVKIRVGLKTSEKTNNATSTAITTIATSTATTTATTTP